MHAYSISIAHLPNPYGGRRLQSSNSSPKRTKGIHPREIKVSCHKISGKRVALISPPRLESCARRASTWKKHEYTLLTAKINEEGRKKKASLREILADDSSVTPCR
jgi:hypothetical protein